MSAWIKEWLHGDPDRRARDVVIGCVTGGILGFLMILVGVLKS